MNTKIDIKKWSGVGMAVLVGLAATLNALTDKQKNAKIDELIHKVDELTKD